VDMERFEGYKGLLKGYVIDFHEKNPLKIGISREELRTRLPRVEPVIFQTALEESIEGGWIRVEQDKVIGATKTESVQALDSMEEEILMSLKRYGLTPPNLKEFAQELGKTEKQTRDILERLVHKKKVVKVKGDIYLEGEVVSRLKDTVVDYMKEKGEMAPGDFRALFNISRKYTIPILEYLDDIKLTIRVGDKRVLRSQKNA